MKKKILKSAHAQEAVAPYSQMVQYGELIFVSGQVAPEAAGDVFSQTSIILKRIGDMLSDVGSSRENILKCMIHLSDMKYFDEMNRAYESYFQADFPARICTAGVQLWGGLEVEIEAVAGI